MLFRSLRLFAFGFTTTDALLLVNPTQRLHVFSRNIRPAAFLGKNFGYYKCSDGPKRNVSCSCGQQVASSSETSSSEESETEAVQLPETYRYRYTPVDSNTKRPHYLVVGDGDLSYSANVAKELDASDITLISSVLESQQAHQDVYRNSQLHKDSISKYPSHRVFFETDGTQLHTQFPPNTFDRVIFNFPHWKGKANNRHNRQLLSDFLKSASQIIKREHGEIHVSLREEQGGAHAKDLTAWKLSWKAAELAAEAGLLLRRLEPFEPGYDVSSYRGGDRPFQVGNNPQRYIFTFPNEKPVEQSLQLCVRHELRIMLNPDILEACPYSEEDILNGNVILNIARTVAPAGVRVEIPASIKITPTPGKSTANFPLLVFLLVYGGEKIPLPRIDADKIRAALEEEVTAQLGFSLAKRGRLVSHPFPAPILDTLIRNM